MKNLIKIKRRLRIEKFLKDELWQYCVVIAYIALCAFIFNKPIEAVLFSIAHCTIRSYVDLDQLYNRSKTAIAKSGQIELAGIIFNETDIDKLYSYIRNTSIQGGN